MIPRTNRADRNSVINLYVPVTPEPGVTIGTQPVYIAINAPNTEPVDSDWHTATWTNTNIATLMVGPGYYPLNPGTYTVRVKIVNGNEVIILAAGPIQIL